MIFINLVRRHLLVAVIRVCAMLVLLISSPLLYCFSTQVVASCLVTTIFTIAFCGLTNKQHLSPSYSFDPSPPIVLHILNVTTFPPKYSSRCTTYYIRPTQPPAKQNPPDPVVFAFMYCIFKIGRRTASILRSLSALTPPYPIIHCLTQYTTLMCLHLHADNTALTQALHTLIMLNIGIAKVLRHRTATFARTLHQLLLRGIVISAFTSAFTWLTNAPPIAVHALLLLGLNPPRNRAYVLFTLPFLCLPLAAASPPAWLDPLDQASSSITSFLTSALSHREPTERPIDTSTSHTVTGAADTAATDLKAMTLNIRGGISQAHKWGMICELTASHDPDILTLCETGHDNAPATLQWLTRKLYPTHHLTQDNITSTHSAALPYLIFSSDGSHQGERGGVVTLLHKRWLHRRVGKPTYDLHKRWHSFDIRTPLGRTTVISAYMKPDPTSPAALTEWDELIDFVASRHLKKRRVILLGDLNISHNTNLTRSKPKPTCIQHEILNRLIEFGGLVDTFPHRHPDTTYSTYTRSTTSGETLSWSAIDHILVSFPDAQRIREVSISNAPTVDFALDHSLSDSSP